jgi:hypothetical protein
VENDDKVEHHVDNYDTSLFERIEDQAHRLMWMSEVLRENGGVYIHEGEIDIGGREMLALMDELWLMSHNLLTISEDVPEWPPGGAGQEEPPDQDAHGVWKVLSGALLGSRRIKPRATQMKSPERRRTITNPGLRSEAGRAWQQVKATARRKDAPREVGPLKVVTLLRRWSPLE